MSYWILAVTATRSYSGSKRRVAGGDEPYGGIGALFLLRETTNSESAMTEDDAGETRPHSALTRASTPALMARAGALFLISGALITPIAVLAPHGPDMDEALLGVVGGAAALLGLFLLALEGRIPRWAFHPLTVIGTVLGTLAIYAWGGDMTYGPLPYLWVTIFAFY